MDPRQVADLLAPHVTSQRRERMERVLAGRIGNLHLVLENLQDPFNVSACLRSAEAFGVQHVHIVETSGPCDLHVGVSQGAEKWVSVTKYRRCEDLARLLAAGGFTLLASSPESGPPALSELDLAGNVAIAFGNERDGLSQELSRLSRQAFHIPMTGFVRSVNVTVAVAVSLRELLLSPRFERRELSDPEKDGLRSEWYRRSVSARLLEGLGLEPPPSPHAKPITGESGS